jgi:ribosome assembly protein YihI (activator of Der GTPase)
VGAAGERLASFINAVADQDENLDTALERLDADDELREVARGLAEHPDRSRLLGKLGLSDRGQVAGNMLFDVLSRDRS